jgi:ActR/RegA family two-component response regulator
MKQEKKKIYNHLLEYQQGFGGYTGKDLDETARIFGLNKRTLKRNVEKWGSVTNFAETSMM